MSPSQAACLLSHLAFRLAGISGGGGRGNRITTFTASKMKNCNDVSVPTMRMRGPRPLHRPTPRREGGRASRECYISM